MVAVTPDVQAPAPAVVPADDVIGKRRTIGLVPSGVDAHRRRDRGGVVLDPTDASDRRASPRFLRSSDSPSPAVVFVYPIRGVEWVERVRSEAVFGMGIPIPPRKMSQHTGFQRWAHQLWLDVSSARFWKGVAHHYLRMIYDGLAALIAFALLMFAFVGPAVATAIDHSDAEAGLSFIPPALAWVLGVVALAAAIAIVVFAPALDASDRPLAAPAVADRGAATQGERTQRRTAGRGVVGADRTSSHRARPARQRPAPAGVAGHDDRTRSDQARQRPTRGQEAHRRGTRRRQERARRAPQRRARYRSDDPRRPRAGCGAVVGRAAHRDLWRADDAERLSAPTSSR